MPLFECSKCGCVENTASCKYWRRFLKETKPYSPPLCSGCDSQIGQWHGKWPQSSAKGMLLGEDGFLYDEPPHHTKILKKL